MTQESLSPRAWTELGLLGLIWGASFLSIRIALDEIGPVWSVAHRVFWASLVLWVFVFSARLPVPRAPRIWASFLVMGLLNNIIPFSLMAWGQLHIATGLTSILNAATAIFGVLAAALFFANERLTLSRFAGVTLGFLGVSTAIGLQSFLSFDVTSLAQLAVIGGTVSYALASIWAKVRLRGLPPQVAAAGMVTSAALVAVPLAYLTEGPPDLALAPDTVAAIGYYSVIATAGAYLLYYRVLDMAGSGNLMLVTLLVAPVAIVLGALVRDEALGVNAYIGFALLAVGLLILSRGSRAEAP